MYCLSRLKVTSRDTIPCGTMSDPGKGRGRGRGRGRGITKNFIVPELTDEHKALFEQSEPGKF